MSDAPTSTVKISPKSMFVAVGVVALAAAFWQIRQILLILLTSVVVASLIEQPTSWLESKKVPRIVSVLLFYIIGFGVFAGALYIFIPLFFDELGSLLTLIPSDSQAGVIVDFLQGGIPKPGTESAGMESLEGLSGELSTAGLFQGLSAFFGGVLNFIIVVVISFYLAIQKNGITQFLRLVTPIEYEEKVVSIWMRTQYKIGAWFKGQLLVALIGFMLTFVGLTIAGVPYALSLAILAGLLGIIPYGIVLATIPAVAIGYVSGGIKMGAIVLAMYFVFQQLENYVWQPVIIKRTTGVPSLVILLSLVIGAKLAGLLGLVLGMPVAVLLVELMSEYEKRRSNKISLSTEAALE